MPSIAGNHGRDVVVRGISTGRTNNTALPLCYPFMVNEDPVVGDSGGIAITIQGVAMTSHFLGGYLGNPFYAISPHFMALTSDS